MIFLFFHSSIRSLPSPSRPTNLNPQTLTSVHKKLVTPGGRHQQHRLFQYQGRHQEQREPRAEGFHQNWTRTRTRTRARARAKRCWTKLQDGWVVLTRKIKRWNRRRAMPLNMVPPCLLYCDLALEEKVHAVDHYAFIDTSLRN